MAAGKPFVVGLTGGIGCGKSTVADLFAEHGVTIVDADAVAHALTRPGGAAIATLREAFGADFITADGALDRARMRELAFGDDAARRRLEAILHPLIRAECQRQTDAAQSPYVLSVVPLLFESGNWKSRVRRSLAIDCPEAMQIERVMQRSGLTADAVRAIMARQVSRKQRLELADDVIDNSGERANLVEPVQRLHQHYVDLAAAADDGL